MSEIADLERRLHEARVGLLRVLDVSPINYVTGPATLRLSSLPIVKAFNTQRAIAEKALERSAKESDEDT